MVSFASPLRVCLTIAVIAFTVTIAAAGQRTEFGTLAIQVRPPDAEIFIDGERWTGSDTNAPLQVQLSPGTHRVEMRAPGRQTFSATVTIRPGQTTPLNVSLVQTGSETAPPEPAPSPAPPPASGAARPPRSSEGGVHVTTGEDGFMIAPDFRVTDINHHTAQLLGAYGGYVFGGQFLVGAGGYWQVDSTDGMHIAYGGPVVEWRVFPDRTVGLNLHGLIGGGWRYADDSYFAHFGGPRVDHRGVPAGRYGLPYGWYDEGFFVADPEAQVVVRLASWIRLQGGVGYRATSSDNTNGASGSVSVQFGR